MEVDALFLLIIFVTAAVEVKRHLFSFVVIVVVFGDCRFDLKRCKINSR